MRIQTKHIRRFIPRRWPIVFVIVALFIGAASLGIASMRAFQQTSPEMPITIRFVARVGQTAFTCGNSYVAPSGGPAWTPTDLRLFISDIRLRTATSEERPLILDEDGEWQTHNVAMLDFENAAGGCDNGTPETH